MSVTERSTACHRTADGQCGSGADLARHMQHNRLSGCGSVGELEHGTAVCVSGGGRRQLTQL